MISRRHFLVRTARALMSLTLWIPARLTATVSDHWRDGGTMQAYVDALIPADETPGALELGVHLRFQEQVKDMWYYEEIIREGAAWLDKQAQTRWSRRFHELDGMRRDELVYSLEKSDRRSIHHKFFRRTRKDVFRLYYSDSRGWPGISYAGPPQPIGFPDYTAMPKGASKAGASTGGL